MRPTLATKFTVPCLASPKLDGVAQVTFSHLASYKS